MPDIVRATLELLKQPVIEHKDVTAKQERGTGYLAHILNQFDLRGTDDYYPLITRYLTPKEYRNTQYNKQNHLHPNDIQGSGHIYLFKIMCHLAGDITVDKELAIDTMRYLNDLWDEPYPWKKLDKTVISPILSGKQTNPNGEPYWEYDENWEDRGFMAADRRGNLIEIFYDDIKDRYYFYNMTEDYISFTDTRSKAGEKARGLFRELKNGELDAHNNVRTLTDPTLDYGHIDDGNFNLFRKSEALNILHDPKEYEALYKRPTEFIDYIEHFIPNEEQRTYLLRLLKTKLMTFNYSPVVPYIIGVQGSGKDLLLSVLSDLIGNQYVETGVGGKQFLEQFNGWLMDKYFIQLNELSNSLNNKSDKEAAQGLLKTYTGSQEVQIRRMHKDHFTYPQTAMFIMTANSSPLAIEDNDRRIYYIATPNTFDHSPQCRENGPTEVYKAIRSQTNDIAYWISTNYSNLSDLEYVRAPDSEGKMAIIFDTLPISIKITWALANQEFDLLNEYLLDPHLLFDVKHNSQGYVALGDVTRAYSAQTGKSIEDSNLIMKGAMKAQGFPYTRKTGNENFYTVKGIDLYDGSYEIDPEADDIPLEETTRT